jgi:hypothetical protein
VLPCYWEVRGHCIYKEIPVIQANRVVDPKSIIGKKWKAEEEEERHKGRRPNKTYSSVITCRRGAVGRRRGVGGGRRPLHDIAVHDVRARQEPVAELLLCVVWRKIVAGQELYEQNLAG